MAKDKNEPATPTPDQLLERRVDAMMDPSAPDASAASKPPATQPADNGELPPLDIFTDPRTAPEVPRDLLKNIGADGETAKLKPAAAASAGQPQPLTAEAGLDDPTTDKAVDDIAAQESDEALAKEDAEQAEAAKQTEPVELVNKRRGHPVFWIAIFLLCLIAALAAYVLISGTTL